MNNIIIFIGLLLSCISCGGGNENIYTYNKGLEYRAIILDIYLDKKNHDLYRFKISTSNDDIYAAYYIKSWDYATIGDSIIKKRGDSFITIKKKDGTSQIFETRVK